MSLAQSHGMAFSPAKEPQSAPGARRALAGFFVSGLLFSFFGAILPSWGHHLRSDYPVIGLHFFSAALGILLSMRTSGWLLKRRGTRYTLVGGCVLACAGLLYLALVSPPVPAWFRMPGVLLIGAAAGLLHAAIFQAISPLYRENPAATANLAGTLFGVGCLAAALLISGTFYVYTVPSILTLLAVIPGMFAILYSKVPYPAITGDLRRPIGKMIADLHSPAAVLFALLLFFQFGNEWAIAGWLPVFLVQRLGISPAKSLLLLAIYWLALLVGRIVVQSMLARVSHAALLAASAAAALLGCLILALTVNPFGAMTGIVFVGSGFAAIYPLVVEKLGNRFPDYHPGFYNGVFSLALTGAFFAPCTLGYFASRSGIQVVMLLPLFGTIMVLLLLVAIRVVSRLERQGMRTEPSPSGPA